MAVLRKVTPRARAGSRRGIPQEAAQDLGVDQAMEKTTEADSKIIQTHAHTNSDTKAALFTGAKTGKRRNDL